jgi:hypothetical protein
MEHPKELLNAALKEAMKNKDNERRDVIRLLTSAIKQVEIDTQKEVTAEQAQEILQKEAKKRRESIAELTNAGRAEQAAAEQFELAVLEEFLPRQLTPDEITALARDAIAQTGAASGKDMGRVMGALQPLTKGRADGKLVSQIVKDLLGG